MSQPSAPVPRHPSTRLLPAALTQAPTLRVDGDFLIQAGQLFAGPFSPNQLQFHGDFTANSGTALGNQGSTSDGSFWNLANTTAINLNGFDPSSILLPALSGGAIWDTSQFLSDGILMVTPAPSRALMLALAALALFSRRRR